MPPWSLDELRLRFSRDGDEPPQRWAVSAESARRRHKSGLCPACGSGRYKRAGGHLFCPECAFKMTLDEVWNLVPAGVKRDLRNPDTIRALQEAVGQAGKKWADTAKPPPPPPSAPKLPESWERKMAALAKKDPPAPPPGPERVTRAAAAAAKKSGTRYDVVVDGRGRAVDARLNFGRNHGKLLSELASHEEGKGYLRWMLSESFPPEFKEIVSLHLTPGR